MEEERVLGGSLGLKNSASWVFKVCSFGVVVVVVVVVVATEEVTENVRIRQENKK